MTRISQMIGDRAFQVLINLTAIVFLVGARIQQW